MSFQLVSWFSSFGIIGQILWSIVICELLRRVCSKIYYDHIYSQPPGPAGIPIIGSLISIINTPRSFFNNAASKYGPIMSINMGLQRNIFVNDKKCYKKLCAENKSIGVDKPHFNYIDLVCKEPSIDLVNGKQWRLRRKLLSSSFVTLVDSKFVSKTVDFSMNNIADKLDTKSDNLWFPRQDIKYIVFNVAFKALLGSGLQPGHKLLPRFFELNTALFNLFGPFIIFDMFQINFLPRWLVEKLFLGKLARTMQELFDLIENYMVTEGGFKVDKQNEIIERVSESKDNHSDNVDACVDDTKYYIDTVMNYLQQDKEKREISFYSLIFDFNAILSAAADTTAHSMEYAICLLCKHQNIQQIIYDEIVSVLEKHKKDRFDISVIHECVHLRAFVYEALRISNVVPLNPHFNDKDINLEYGGKTYFIPKNTAIFINTQYIHYAGFDASLELNLNNWIDANGKFKMNSEFILFGMGKRNCVGQTLAMRELYYVLAILLLKYKLEVKDKTEMKKLEEMKQAWSFITTLEPEIGVNLTKRK